MYLAKYKLNNDLEVEQKILKIDILDKNKNMDVYNSALKEILSIDKDLYENIAFRVSIINGKIQLVLFFTAISINLYFDKIKERLLDKFSSKIIVIVIPKERIAFDEIKDLKFSSSINRLHNSSYSISNKQIGIDFTVGNFIEKMIDIAIKRKWNFVYQFQLKPYSSLEKKELERYAKKYMLQLENEVYLPDDLNLKLNSLANSMRNKDFFIDEVFGFEKETKEFYEMLLSDEFALELSTYGFEDLPLESDDLAEDILSTGLSSYYIDEVSEVSQIFSSVSNESLEEFFFEDLKGNLQNHAENNILKSYDIFISYSTVNTKEAESVCIELENIDYKCWYAPRDILPSQAYPEQIIKGIKESKYFILLHSKDSTVSKYVLREVTKALSLNKIIIPIFLDKVKLSENMEFILEACQYIDASEDNLYIKTNELKLLLSKL